MENDLKNIWHKKQANIELPKEKIDNITKIRSTNIIDKISKTIKMEHWINIVSYPIITTACIYYDGYLEALFVSLIFIPFLFYYHNLLNKLKKVDIQSNVIEYLKSCQSIFQKFVSHYKRIGVLLTIISFFVGLNLTGGFLEMLHEIKMKDIRDQVLTISFLLMGILFSIALVLIIVRLLYGKKLKALNTMIEELETSD